MVPDIWAEQLRCWADFTGWARNAHRLSSELRAGGACVPLRYSGDALRKRVRFVRQGGQSKLVIHRMRDLSDLLIVVISAAYKSPSI